MEEDRRERARHECEHVIKEGDLLEFRGAAM